jgi:hypothetical protein
MVWYKKTSQAAARTANPALPQKKPVKEVAPVDTQEGNTIPDKVQERWLPIPDFPGYEVSDLGRVRSYWKGVGQPPGVQGQIPGGKTIADTPQRLLKGSLDKGGYHRVILSKEGKHHHFKTHALVLDTFIGPCPPGMQGCHGDGIRTHNWLSNLRWDSCKNNHHDRLGHGTAPSGERNGQSVLTETDVIQIRALFAQGGYSKRNLGEMFNVSPSNIGHIIHRQSWTHLP